MTKLDEIYEKALNLFIEAGYDNTPMSLIASELGLSKAGLYHYFNSKEELLFFIHERNLKEDFIPIIDSAEKISDPEERIIYFIKNYIEKNLTANATPRVLVHEVRKLKPENREKIYNIWRRAVNLIRDAISEMETMGKVKNLNKTFAAFAAIGMCSWTFYWFDYARKESSGELADAYSEIFLKGLLK